MGLWGYFRFILTFKVVKRVAVISSCFASSSFMPVFFFSDDSLFGCAAWKKRSLHTHTQADARLLAFLHYYVVFLFPKGFDVGLFFFPEAGTTAKGGNIDVSNTGGARLRAALSWAGAGSARRDSPLRPSRWAARRAGRGGARGPVRLLCEGVRGRSCQASRTGNGDATSRSFFFESESGEGRAEGTGL